MIHKCGDFLVIYLVTYHVSTRQMSLVVLVHHVFSLAALAFVCCTLTHRFCGNTLDYSSRICTKLMSLFGSHFHQLFL